MIYRRPESCLPRFVDVYCCRLPDCKKRLRVVEAGALPPSHCGRECCFVASIPAQRWIDIVNRNDVQIKAIRGRVEAAKIRKERAA